MRTFNYTMNHKADEAYMARMCHEGWAATRLVEGFWTFEPCAPGQYVYHVCYLRGKSAAEVEELKRSLAARGIEFVSRYSFWAICRSEHDFRLYEPEEKRAVCEKILRPMRIGAPVSWLAFLAALGLTLRVSAWFTVLLAVYAAMRTALGVSYTRLLRTMGRDEK